MTTQNSDSILITYFSHSGNTEKIARRIKEIVGGELIRIEPVEEYPRSYREVLKVSKEEILNNFKPKLKKKMVDMEKYDTIFVGSPNWYGTIAPPVISFLSKYNFSKKKVVPFISHGGGGLSNCFSDFKKNVPNAILLEEMIFYGSNDKSVNKKILLKID